MENIQQIINRTKLLTDRLRLAILHQDSLTNNTSNKNSKEYSKTVEALSKTYVELEKKYQQQKQTLKELQSSLDTLSQQYEKIVTENNCLTEKVNSLEKLAKPINNEHYKTAQELKDVLKAYKLLTGVRFDFDEINENISGYIGISHSEAYNNILIPFDISKDISSANQPLWDLITEACACLKE